MHSAILVTAQRISIILALLAGPMLGACQSYLFTDATTQSSDIIISMEYVAAEEDEEQGRLSTTWLGVIQATDGTLVTVDLQLHDSSGLHEPTYSGDLQAGVTYTLDPESENPISVYISDVRQARGGNERISGFARYGTDGEAIAFTITHDPIPWFLSAPIKMVVAVVTEADRLITTARELEKRWVAASMTETRSKTGKRDRKEKIDVHGSRN